MSDGSRDDVGHIGQARLYIFVRSRKAAFLTLLLASTALIAVPVIAWAGGAGGAGKISGGQGGAAGSAAPTDFNHPNVGAAGAAGSPTGGAGGNGGAGLGALGAGGGGGGGDGQGTGGAGGAGGTGGDADVGFTVSGNGGGGGGDGGNGIGISSTLTNAGTAYTGGAGGDGGGGGVGSFAFANQHPAGAGGGGGGGGAGGNGIVFSGTAASLTNGGLVTGGRGGNGGNGGIGGVGAAGGPTFNDGPTGGAGGPAGAGGAGGVGIAITGIGVTLTNTSTIKGGAGGNGGNGGNGSTGSSGGDGIDPGSNGYNGGNGGVGGAGNGGGAGGIAITVSGVGATLNNSGTITGGNGGAGGNGGNGGSGGPGGAAGGNASAGTAGTTGAGGAGGAGGNAGAAVVFSAGGSLINSGTISIGSAGSGGAGGTGSAFGGNGAAGSGNVVAVSGANLSIVNSGSITGGSTAITFTSGTNLLELDAGSTINGLVQANGSADTLRLGGGTNFSFDMSTILSQYQGFEALAKSGSGTVTLTGVGGGNAPWTISSGVLVFSSGLMLGGGAVTLDGGTLRAGANIPNLSNAIKVNTTGGAIDAGGNNVTLAGGITHGNGANGTLTFTNSSATSGVVNLSAASTYAGATVVGDGTHVAVLQSVGANIFSPNSAVTVNANSVLSLNNNQSIASLAGTGQVLGTGAGTTPTLTTGGNNSSTTFSGVIGNGGSATLSLTKAGTGTMTLSGTNSYTGATTISAGTLALSGAGGIAASSGVADNGTFDISATTAGASLASLTGNGGVTLGGKTLTLTSAGGTYSGNIGGTGGVSVTGGTLGLTGTNSYTGATIIGSGGALTLASTNAVAASSGVQADGVVSTITAGSANFNIKSLSGSGFLQFIATSPQTLTLTNAGGTFSGVISVLNALPSTYGALVITGGTQTLTGANTYGGGTTITGGTIVAGNNSALGTGAVTLDGGTLKAGGNFTLSNAITINTTAGTIDTGGGNTLILNGAITNGNGAGTLTIANSGGGTGLVFLNSSGNTYSGATVIGDGTSAVVFDNAGGAFSPNSAVTVNGNSVLLLTSSQTVASLAGAGTVRASAAATLTTGGDNSSTLFSGTIIDSIGMVALTKTGTGTLTLSGVNTYTDNTTISAGTLALSASGSIAASRSVSGAGTLDISATNAGASIIALTGNTTVNLGARTLTITNGQSADYSGNIRGTGGVSITGGILQMTGTTEYTGVTIVGSGAQLAMASSGIEASSNLQLDGNLQVTDLYGTSNFRIHSISGAGSILFSPVSSGMVTLTLTNASGTFSGTMGGAAQAFDLKSALVITGGHETLSGGNSYGGGTTISGGATLSANHLDVDSTIDALGTGTITLAGGTLETLVGGPLYQGITVTADSTIAAASGKTLTLASAPGSLTVGNATLSFGSASDTGTVILSPTSATVASSAAIAVTGGTLKLGNAAGAGAVVAAGGLTVGTGVTPATFDLGGQNVTLGGLAGNAQGIVTDSGSAVTLTVNNAVASGFAGVIKDGAGAISFTKTGTGTLILAGANAYGGTTTISGGTLQIGNGSASGALGTGNVVNNAILAFNRSDAWQYAGTISGSGAVNVLAGNLVLTAANSYAGGTSIASGATLQLGIPTANGSIAGNVADAGTLAFNNGSSQTYAGIISGSGQVTKAAAGTLILTGANSYGGGTTITFGTLQVGAGGTVGSLGSGAIADNGALVFNRSDSITLANTLAGNGTFTQAGGTIIYDGNGGGFTGTTTVNGGTLEVGDTATPGAVLGGTVNVASGATLMGHGTVGSTALASGATLAPGGSIGTLTVNGSLTLASGSTLAMEISPTAADKVVVNGNATLGGVLAVTQSGSVPAADYKLITASSTSGTFSSITGISFAGLNSTLQYSATGADLILSNPVVARPPTITYLFQSYGKTPNQVAAGTALYAGASTGTLYTAAGALVTSGPVAAANTLEQLAGDIHASVRAAAIEDSRLIRNAMLDQLGRTGEGANVWINGFGDYGGVASDGNASALHHTVSGVAGGVDMIAAPGLRIGLGGAFSANDAGSEARQSNASGHMAHILGYAGYSIDALDLRIGGDYGSGTLDTSRALAAFGQALTSRRDQSLTQAFGEAGWRLTGDFAMAEPYAGIAHVAANDGAFAETGGSAALSGASRTDQVTYAMLGVKGSLARIDLGGAVLTPTADIAWNHAFNRFLPGQLLTYQDAATSFTALGTPLAQDSAAIQLGADLAIGDNAMLSLGYDGKLSSSTDSHGVRGGLSWTF